MREKGRRKTKKTEVAERRMRGEESRVRPNRYNDISEPSKTKDRHEKASV